MLGLASKIHEMVIRTPGMMIRAIIITPKKRASGMFVRSTAHATNAPSTKARIVDAPAKMIVFHIADQKASLAKARAKFWSEKASDRNSGSPGRTVLRLVQTIIRNGSAT